MIQYFIILLSCLYVTCSNECPADVYSLNSCPVGWESFKESCYYIEISAKRTLAESRNFCINSGGKLVHIRDNEEFQFLTLKLTQNTIITDVKWYTSGEMNIQNPNNFYWMGYPIEDRKFSVELRKLFLDIVPDINNMDKWDSTRNQVVIGTNKTHWGFNIITPEEPQFLICEVAKNVVTKQLPRTRQIDFNQFNISNILRGPCITKEPTDQTYLPKVFNTKSVSFEVLFIGNPPPTVTWYFIGSDSQNPVLTLLDPTQFPNGKVSQISGILTIVEPEDSRFYSKIQAHITNQFGTVISKHVQVIRGSLGEFQSGTKTLQEYEVNDMLLLDFEIPNHSPPESLKFSYMDYRVDSQNIERSSPIQPELRPNLFLSANLGKIGFSTVLPRDTAQYVCMIQWKDMESSGTSFNSPKHPIKVKSTTKVRPSPQLDEQFPNMRPSSPKLGDKTVLECFGYGPSVEGPLDYVWKWNDGPLATRHQLSDFNRRIVIDSIQFQDEGTYSCYIQSVNKQVSPKRSLTIKLQAYPTFINRPINQYVDLKSNASFSCIAMGRPEITLHWYRNSQKLTEFLADPNNQKDYAGRFTFNEGKAVTSSTLSISDIKSLDNAMYGCIITSDLGMRSSYAELKTFAFAPTFNKFPVTNVEAMAGQSMIIPCRPEGAPNPTVTWKLNNATITTPPTSQNQLDGSFTCQHEYCILPNNNLNISSVTEGSRGYYTCVAENMYGKAESTGYLEVVSGVVPILQPVGRRILVGSNVVLPCQVSSSPSMDVDYDWYFENVRIKFDRMDLDSRRHDASQFDRPYNKYFGYMTISNIQFYDEGTYSCKIMTPVSTLSYEAYYVIIGPPGPCGGLKVFKSQTSNLFTVEWTDGDNRGYPITKYRFEVRKFRQFNDPYITLDEFAVNQTTERKINEKLVRRQKDFTGLAAATKFDLRIIAFNALGEGIPSPPGNITTDSTPPAKVPQNITGGGGKIFTLVVQWNKLALMDENGEGFGYDVQIRQTKEEKEWIEPADRTIIRNIKEAGVDKYRQATITLTNKKYYEIYEVRVRAKNLKGPGPWSEAHTIRSAPNMPQSSIPDVEVNSYNSTALQVFWKKPTILPIEGEIIGYHILYWLRNHDCIDQRAYMDRLRTSQRLSLYGLKDDELTGIIIGLEPDSYYCVCVQAINAAGDGPEASFFDQTTFKMAPQNFPTLVHLNSTGRPSTVMVKFVGVRVNPDEESIDGYKVRYWLAGASVKTALDKDAGMKPEVEVSGLLYNVRYNLRVFAYSRGGVGKLSNPMVQFTLIPASQCIKDQVTEGVDVTFVFICAGCSKTISLTLLVCSILFYILRNILHIE